MHETYRMSGRGHEADLARDARKWQLAADRRAAPRAHPTAESPLVSRDWLLRAVRCRVLGQGRLRLAQAAVQTALNGGEVSP